MTKHCAYGTMALQVNDIIRKKYIY